MVIHNRLLPFKGFTAINLFGLIFVRKGVEMNRVLNGYLPVRRCTPVHGFDEIFGRCD